MYEHWAENDNVNIKVAIVNTKAQIQLEDTLPTQSINIYIKHRTDNNFNFENYLIDTGPIFSYKNNTLE